MATATAKSKKFSEQSRLRGRDRVKEEIAAAEVAMGHYRALERQQQQLDARIDEAVNAHQATCLPAQERIRGIEAKMTAALTDRQPIPASLEDERLEALEEIRATNEALEETKTKLGKLRAALEREKQAVLRGADNITVLQNRLSQAPLANPTKLIELHIAKQATRWLQSRLNAAIDQRQTWASEIKKLQEQRSGARMNNYGNFVANDDGPSGTERVYSERLERWTAEEKAAGEAVQESLERSNRLHRELIEE